MLDLRRMVQDLRRGERSLALTLVGSYTLVMVGLYLLKPARDSLFLTYQSAADLPYAFVLTAVLAIPMTLAYGRASRAWSQARLLAVGSVWSAVVLVVWWWLLQRPSPLVTYLFYAWTGVAGGLVTSQFWLLGNAICDARQAKRLFPLLSLGGIGGAVLGGWSTDRAAAWFGLDALSLILVAAVVWALAIGLAALALRFGRVAAAPESSRRRRRVERGGRRTPWRQFLASRHLLLISATVAIGVVVSTFADFVFKTAAAAAYPDGGDLLGFLGKFYAAMNLASFLLQAAITSRLLRGLGVGGALLVLPSILSMGTSALIAVPGLVTATVLRGAEMSLKYSLDKTSRELIYLPLPLGLKRDVKVFVDTFVERGSRGLAGVLLILATSALGLSLTALGLIILVLLMLWLVVADAMRREYVDSFRGAVARREIGGDDLRTSLRDPTVVATLTSSLAADDPREVAYALAVLRGVPAADLPPGVTDLLAHPAPEVRQRALAVALEARLHGCQDAVRRLLGDDQPEIGRLAAEYLHRVAGLDELRAALTADPAVRASIFGYVARTPSGRELPLTVTVDDLRTVIASCDAAVPLRQAAAALLGRTWEGSLEALRFALRDAPAELQGEAMVGLARRGERRHLRPLADLLGAAPLRPYAQRALGLYGPGAVPLLLDLGVDPVVGWAARRAALRVLARTPYQRTVDLIITRLGEDDDEARGVLIPVLARLRERRADLRFPRRAIDELLWRESQQSRRMFTVAARLGPASDAPAEVLLRRVLAESRERRMLRLFQLLALRYDHRDIMGGWLRITSEDRTRRAEAREFLENLIAPRHRILVERAFYAGRRPTEPDREASLLSLLETGNRWLRCCVIWAADPHPYGRLAGEIRRLAADPDPLVAETAAAVLDVDRRKVTMLTTIEKAILLQRVDQFDAVASDQMAAIAAIATEHEFADGDDIYRAGEAGDAMYLVVDGEVSLRRGEAEIVRAAAGEAFGTWALFEVEERMVTARAAGECRLLRIDREDFIDLMAEDIVVAQSLLRSIARRLRELASRAA